MEGREASVPAGAFDRLLASQLGAAAVAQRAAATAGVLVGLVRGDIVTTPLEEAIAPPRRLDSGLLDPAKILAR